MSEHDCVADEALLKLRALGCDDATIKERLNQAVMLESAGASEAQVLVLFKIVATDRVAPEDINSLRWHTGLKMHNRNVGEFVGHADSNNEKRLNQDWAVLDKCQVSVIQFFISKAHASSIAAVAAVEAMAKQLEQVSQAALSAKGVSREV